MSSGGKKNDGKGSTSGEDDGGGWVSTLFKVAGAAAATAAVAGSMYSLMKEPEPEQVVAYRGAGAAAGAAGHTREALPAVWTKPMAGWVKLNVDGSRLPRFGTFISTGCGGVLRDASGNWVCGFAQKLDRNLREDETEKEGIFRGLQWARGKGVRKVKVESDNEGVVDLVKNGHRSSDPLICGIRELLSTPHWEATLTLIHANANKLAEKVAHNAHDLPHFHVQEFDSPPDQNCKLALSNDGGGRASTFLEVAGAAVATVAVAGGAYVLMRKQPEPEKAVPAVAWTKPKAGWLKLNVDGSLCDSSVPVTAGCGGVLRDATGNWVCGFAQKLKYRPNLTSDETEREAILRGLEWAREKDYVKKVMLESDNEGVVGLVKNKLRRPNDRLLRRIRELLSSEDWEVTLTLIGRNANKLADTLAHIAHGLPDFVRHEFRSPPDDQNCKLFLDREMHN